MLHIVGESETEKSLLHIQYLRWMTNWANTVDISISLWQWKTLYTCLYKRNLITLKNEFTCFMISRLKEEFSKYIYIRFWQKPLE